MHPTFWSNATVNQAEVPPLIVVSDDGSPVPIHTVRRFSFALGLFGAAIDRVSQPGRSVELHDCCAIDVPAQRVDALLLRDVVGVGRVSHAAMLLFGMNRRVSIPRARARRASWVAWRRPSSSSSPTTVTHST